MQLIAIGSCYLLGTIIVSVFISSVALNDSWMIGAIAAVFFIPVLFIYFSLLKKYPGKNLFEMNEAVFGSFLGRIISIIYFLFFLSLCALNIFAASNFLHYFLMPDTPLIAISAFFMLACVYCAKKGIAPIARVSTVFCLAALGVILLNIILSFTQADFEYLFPMFQLKPLDYVQSIHIATAIPFGESIFLLMLAPDLSEKASMKKVYIAVAIFTVIIMTLVHFREVLSLGPLIAYTTLPSYETVRMINIANMLSRVESLFAVLIISLTFFKTVILFHVCVKSVTQIFRLESSRHIFFMLAAFLVIYGITAYDSMSSDIYNGKNILPFIWSFFSAALPLVTLIVSAIKSFILKRKKKRLTQT